MTEIDRLEPERYELAGEAVSDSTLGELRRRDFFKVLGGGVLIVLLLDDAFAQQRSRPARRAAGSDDIGAWLHIAEDGAVTVYTGKVEVGQDIRTSLTQAVAEELHAPPASIKLVMGDTELTPYDMGTFGSRTTPHMNRQLREAAAAARETLLDLAAAHWRTERHALAAAGGKIVDREAKRTLGYGELTQGKRLLKPIRETVLKAPTEWRVAGKPLGKVAGRDIITGKHRYVPDLKRPGMLYGKVLRAPAFGAKRVSLDTREAERLAGVTVARDGEFVGVAAPSEHRAAQALAAIRAEWKTTPQISHNELYRHLRGKPLEPAPADAPDRSRALRLAQAYTIAYIAHAPLEPRAALAEWQDGNLTVWTGTQRPFGVRSELSRVFGLSEDRVRVIMRDTGSGYGGKHTGEAAVEGASRQSGRKAGEARLVARRRVHLGLLQAGGRDRDCQRRERRRHDHRVGISQL